MSLFEACMDISKAKKYIKIDLSLVRGLDYYTGMIYEAVVDEPKIGSLSGGGRYDNLIGIFTNTQIPAVGGSIGVERLIDAGLETGILNYEKSTFSDIGIITLSKNVIKYGWDIAEELRKNDVNTYMSYEPQTPISGIKHLEKRGIKYVIFVGEDEVKTNTITFQNLETRE
jgi:histidyl-tRNA synthetase